MDNTAIQAIGQLAVEAEKANRLDTYTPAIVLRDDDGKQRVWPLENLQAHRSRFRGTFSTTSMQDFMAYVVAYAGAQGFIDPDRMAANAIFNLVTQVNDVDGYVFGHADHRAVLTLKKSPAFDALCKCAGAVLAQKTMVEWLEDWADYLAADFGDERSVANDPTGIKSAITALRKVKIKASGESVHTNKDFGASKSALEDIEASSDIGLPRGFRFACVPYDGFDAGTFYLRLGVRPDPEKPTFTLRWPHVNEDLEKLGQQFKAKLLDGIGNKATMLLGSFDPGK